MCRANEGVFPAVSSSRLRYTNQRHRNHSDLYCTNGRRRPHYLCHLRLLYCAGSDVQCSHFCFAAFSLCDKLSFAFPGYRYTKPYIQRVLGQTSARRNNSSASFVIQKWNGVCLHSFAAVHSLTTVPSEHQVSPLKIFHRMVPLTGFPKVGKSGSITGS